MPLPDLPAQFLSTPFGQSLRPHIDAMFSPAGSAAAGAGLSGPPANALSNNDIASTLLSHVAAAASSQQQPAARSTPAAAARDGTLSSTLHLATSPTSLHELLDTHEVVITNFTAPKTCAPCRAIAPTFETLASLRSAELAGNAVAFVEVDLGIGRGSEAAQEWGVRATPTFVFFHKGRKTDELKGANGRELEAAVDRWLWQAFPPHPHESLPLPAIKAVPTTPILFTAQPNYTALLVKLLPALEGASAPPADERAMIQRFVENEVVPFLQTKALSSGCSLDRLISTWAAYTGRLQAQLGPEQIFPLYDLWRVALLDPKVSSLVAMPQSAAGGGRLLLALFIDLFALPSDAPRAYVLTVLRLVANCFSSLGLATILVTPSSPSRTAFTTLLVDHLLSTDESIKSAAAAIAFNVASVRHRMATGRLATAVEAGGEDEADWTLEIVFAILEAIKIEDRKEDILHRLVSALGLILLKSPHTADLAPNLEVLGAKAILESKLALVTRKDIRALVVEVAGQLS